MKKSISIRITVILVFMMIFIILGGVGSIIMDKDVKSSSELIIDNYVKLLG